MPSAETLTKVEGTLLLDVTVGIQNVVRILSCGESASAY